MSEVITLPADWAIYTRSNWASQAGNMLRNGWVSVSGFQRYLSLVKFNTAQLTTLGIKERHILSAKIKYSQESTDQLSIAIHRVLRAATNAATWYTYDGSNNWGAAGATGSADRVSTPIGTVTYSGAGVSSHEFLMSAADLFALHTGNTPLGFYTTSDTTTPTGPYSEIQDFNINIEVAYKKPGLAGEVIIF